MLDTQIIILPGNGSFGAGVENLKKKKFDILLNNLRKEKILIIGICLGMQLFFLDIIFLFSLRLFFRMSSEYPKEL